MYHNPFTPSQQYENDPLGLVLPYKLVSRTDKAVLTAKYQQLRKASRGTIVRLGIPEKGN